MQDSSNFKISSSYPTLKEFVDPFNHPIHVGIRQESVHRQAQHARAEQICIWAASRPELRESFLAMQGHGIMGECWYAAFIKVTAKSVAVRSCDDKQVSVALAGLGLQPDRQFTKRFPVFFRNGAPPAVPFVKSSEVDTKDCCMQLIEAAVFAKDLDRKSV